MEFVFDKCASGIFLKGKLSNAHNITLRWDTVLKVQNLTVVISKAYEKEKNKSLIDENNYEMSESRSDSENSWMPERKWKPYTN